MYRIDPPEDLDGEPAQSKSPVPISLSGAFKLVAIAAVSVGVILSIEGVVPWQSAVTPTSSPDRVSLVISATGVPPIREQGTAASPGPTVHPLSTPPLGPPEVLTGVIVGGVTDPPRIPVVRKAAATPTPTPFQGFGTTAGRAQPHPPSRWRPGGGHRRFRPRGF